MSLKASYPTDRRDEPLPPPSYAETISGRPPSTQSRPYSTQISSLLLDLTTQLDGARAKMLVLNTERDSKVLSGLDAAIQSYLSSFAESGLRRGTLILIPANALKDEKAIPCEYDFANPAEFDRVVRVRIGEKGDSGNDLWFWEDEGMAARLASYIAQPKHAPLPPRPLEQQASSAAVRSNGRGIFRKRSTAKVTEDVVLEPARSPVPIAKREAGGDSRDAARGYGVEMDVTAKEILFRTENELGLYETERGWGIFLQLDIIP